MTDLQAGLWKVAHSKCKGFFFPKILYDPGPFRLPKHDNFTMIVPSSKNL